ncbi:MAG: CHAD domain-containing protein [Pseudomonadota bacterium]
MGRERNRLTASESCHHEVELRLVGEPEALKTAFNACLTTPGPLEGETTSSLESSYFDTADHRLREQGLALRIRKKGKEHKQTLKSGDDAQALLLSRGEWEAPLSDDQPSLDKLPEEARSLVRKATGKRKLRRLFTTRFERRVCQLVSNAPNEPVSRIEAALDLGEIKTEAGALPVAELELELLEGPPHSLYRIAKELHGSLPLRLETRSKSSRAYHHIADEPPPWQRASSTPLSLSTSVDDAMMVIFKSCFDQWLANQAAAMDGRDPEGVHQMRVGIRRLRSALSVFQGLIPASQLEWLRPAARMAIQSLSSTRDWDVFQSDILAPVLVARPHDKPLIALNRKVNTRRLSSYRAMRKGLSGRDYNNAMLSIGEWLERRSWQIGRDAKQEKRANKPIADFASHLLDKRHRKATTRGAGFADLPVAARHDVRILLKKLRYAAEFFAPLFKKKSVKPYLDSLKALQDDLGHLNDLAVAETLLNELTLSTGKRDIGGAAGMVIGWHERGVASLEPELIQNWQAFTDHPPFWK